MMMIFLFSLFLKVIPPKEVKYIIPKEIRQYIANCETNEKTDYGEYSSGWYQVFISCVDAKKDTFGFKYCTFKDIKMTADTCSYLIMAKTNLLVENTKFTDNLIFRKLICCEGESFKLDFKYNEILNTQFDKGTLYFDTYTIYSEFKTQDISYNYIKSEPTGQIGNGYYLRYHSGCTFQGNTIINCYDSLESGAGGLSFEKQGEKEPLKISDCIFTNCRSKDASILKIPDLQQDLAIYNVTFEETRNEDGNYLIKITPSTSRRCQLTFSGCTFSHLTSNSESGGGIGLLFTKDSNSENVLEFDETKFNDITNTNTEFGGSISIASGKSNSMTQLRVINCNFEDVFSKGFGGAIYFNPSDVDEFCSFTITGTNFRDARSSNEGHAIYVEKTGSRTNLISNCIFIDCCNDIENKYSIHLNVRYYSFNYNEITFINPNKNHACVYSSIYDYHEYIGNKFSNANTNGNFAAGIHERSPTTSAGILIKNNTFEKISGSSSCRCFAIDTKNFNELNIINNTIIDCPEGGILFQIRITEMNVETFTLDSINFINNKVDTTWSSTYDSAPQILLIEYPATAGFFDPLTLVFKNCHFYSNYSPLKGGAIHYGKSRHTALTKVHFENCQFIDNLAREGGGAIAIQSYQGCKVDHCYFSQNKAYQGCSSIYIETDFYCTIDGVSRKPENRNPDVQIINSVFENNIGGSHSSCIIVDNSQNAPITIKGNTFTDCGERGSVIDIKNDVKLFTVDNNTIEFTSSIGCGGISTYSKGVTSISNVKFIQTSVNSALKIEPSDSTNLISVTHCTFDSCLANEYSCFYLSIRTNSFIFEYNTIQKIAAKGCDNYIGFINCNDKITDLTLRNINFFNNVGSSLYGGGSSLRFRGIKTLIFDNCNFTNNNAIQDQSKIRISKSTYYNGDGGAIQIGHSCEMNNFVIKFIKCEFIKNKAQRHGGAIAIQTLNEVEIDDCLFDRNIADYDFTSESSLLSNFDDHFHKKLQGRGGAIYINPTYYHQCNSINQYMPHITIKNCGINNNNAFDGYGMYIEGDESDTVFTLLNNNFNNNYNENRHHHDDSNLILGAVIATEIVCMTNKSLNENNNFFNYKNNDLKVNPLLYVDHYGNPPSSEFTQSEFFKSKPFTNSKAFSNSFSFSISDYFSKSGVFSESKKFNPSSDFTHSQYFSETDSFSYSSIFSASSDFTKSEVFSESKKFNPSSDFTHSQYFSKTDSFSSSAMFSTSSDFTRSMYFSKTNSFSSSAMFTKSEIFSKSREFSPSSDFTRSEYFSKTDWFSSSLVFSTSSAFSQSNFLQKETQTYEITETLTAVITGNEASSISKTQTNEGTDTPSVVLTETTINKATDIPPSVETSSSASSISMTEEKNDDDIPPDEKTGNPSRDSISYSTLFDNGKTNAHGSSIFTGDGTGTNNMLKSNKKIKLSLIIGIVIGCIALLAIIVFIIIFIKKRKHSNKTSAENTTDEMNAVGTMSGPSNSLNAEFNNPLYNDARIQDDPFDQAFDEEEIV